MQRRHGRQAGDEIGRTPLGQPPRVGQDLGPHLAHDTLVGGRGDVETGVEKEGPERRRQEVGERPRRLDEQHRQKDIAQTMLVDHRVVEKGGEEERDKAQQIPRTDAFRRQLGDRLAGLDHGVDQRLKGQIDAIVETVEPHRGDQRDPELDIEVQDHHRREGEEVGKYPPGLGPHALAVRFPQATSAQAVERHRQPQRRHGERQRIVEADEPSRAQVRQHERSRGEPRKIDRKGGQDGGGADLGIAKAKKTGTAFKKPELTPHGSVSVRRAFLLRKGVLALFLLGKPRMLRSLDRLGPHLPAAG